MHPGLLILFGFAAAVATVLGIYSVVSDLFLRDRSRVSERVDEEFRSRQRERAQRTMLFKDLAGLNVEAAEEVAKENSWQSRMIFSCVITCGNLSENRKCSGVRSCHPSTMRLVGVR